MKRNKKTFIPIYSTELSLFSKILLIILIISMVLGNLHIVSIIEAINPVTSEVVTDDVERDLSEINKIEEINSLRTSNSKTYLKENGMFETEYYNEKIHYKDKNEWKEIDNTLKLNNNRYFNNANKFSVSFPNALNSSNNINFKYLNNEIKIYYDINNDLTAILSNTIDRTKVNLKDEISYNLNFVEKIQYIIKQDSIKENIILNRYIENYKYCYYIDTTLRIERIGNEIYFYDGVDEVFVMNEYYMYDENNTSSKEIDFEIIVIDDDTYKIEVTPSDEYLKNATYPVVIDPEIRLRDGGIMDGITHVYSNDKQADTFQEIMLGSFSLETRNSSTIDDDKIAYIDIYIPRVYDDNIGDIITQNQLMYANLTLPTISCSNVEYGSKVDLKYVLSNTNDTVYIDSQYFHNTTVFNHKFDILQAFTAEFENYKTNDISLYFELSLDGNDNAVVTYSLGGDLVGDKPIITFGYLDDAGLAEYYTYESLPVSDDMDAFISHNSGNLCCIYNDYNDGNLLNLSHIYNTNRKDNNSPYGNGFSINYNETIKTTSFLSKLILTLGDGREIVFHTKNNTNTEYLASDGSGEILHRLVDDLGETTGYKIETKDDSLKIYDGEGKLTTIYIDKEQYENTQLQDNVKKIIIQYNSDNTISRIDDTYGNYMQFCYLTIANNPSQSQIDKPYLACITIYKNISENVVQAEYLEFLYDEGNLQYIGKYGTSTNSCVYTYFEYNNNYLKKIKKNNRGYLFEYDIKNRITLAKIYSTEFSNGDYLSFSYDSNGKKTKITNGLGQSTYYTFDDYYHTISIETSDGYTTFYRYQDIYYNSDGTIITSPNYNLNHKIIMQSNSFNNVDNPITNHGFEIVSSSGIAGWTTELTNNSTAKLNNKIYLYGSMVLELKKTSNGIAKVYQEIPVESGKTYIVSGYIHNNSNSGNGAYIDVVGISGTITKISSSNNVKNTNNFVRFEYKFTSSYTGTAKLYLVNSSIGKAYFDNIQINTKYIDTRYNYLENASFEVETLSSLQNGEFFGWQSYYGCELIDTISNSSQQIFNENCGKKYIRLHYNSTLSQTIHTPGKKGDTFVFGGYCFYENYTGNVTVTFNIISEDNINTKVFTFDQNDINYTYMMNKLTATEDYVAISIEIKNNTDTSYASIDNFAIYKEGYGINLSYDDNGNITNEYNEITNSTSNYVYDENGNLIKITTNNDETDLTYNNNYLNKIENQNIVTTINSDINGNIEDISSVGKINENEYEQISYFYGSTTYTSDGLYPSTSTNVFNKVTSYTYDYLTGLVTSVLDSNDILTEYTYDNNGNIISLITGKGNNKKTITYTYDVNGNLLTIVNESLTYTFTYNNYGDLKTISVGNSLLLTNNYKNENSISDIYTGELVESVYSYGTVFLEYNDNHLIEKIYNGTTESKWLVLEYTYNDYGEIVSYTDYKENVTYYYNYDYENKLINVNATNGNNIIYTYDDDSNLISKENINGINNYVYSDFNSDEDIENNKLTSESIANKFNISYNYKNDTYKQLETINYFISTTAIKEKYTYETTINDNKTYYTGRIKELEFTNGNNQIIKYVYDYDDYNNISKIYGYTNGEEVYYEENYYDIFNELTAQWVEFDNTIIVSEYGYDSRGNVIGYYSYNQSTSKSLYNASFSYNNNNEMTQAYINGQNYNISYSSTGQPNIYFDFKIDYDMRNICAIENDDYYVEYYYNANGIRIGKLIENENYIEEVNYIYDESNIIREIHSGTTNYTIEYYYDSNDDIIGFTYNGNKYLYLKNLQNDIFGIVDSNNNIVVKYYYDGYGRILETIDTSGVNISTINPLRYRGYYQDNETGWYYLNSRYYNPLTNNFITMDQIEYLGQSESVLSVNLFSYCENNPINLYDKYGTDAMYVVDFSVLRIAGHAIVYYEYNGEWYKTEYNGTKKWNAKVSNERLLRSKEDIIRSFSKYKKYLCIEGDFSKAYNYAEKYNETNYGGYNLITNNCLHYAKNVLKKGKYNNNLLNLYIRSSKTIVPSVFLVNAYISSKLPNCWLSRAFVRRLV